MAAASGEPGCGLDWKSSSYGPAIWPQQRPMGGCRSPQPTGRQAGWDLEDSIALAAGVERERDADYICTSSGGTTLARENHNWSGLLWSLLNEAVRRGVDIPTTAVGQITSSTCRQSRSCKTAGPILIALGRRTA